MKISFKEFLLLFGILNLIEDNDCLNCVLEMNVFYNNLYD